MKTRETTLRKSLLAASYKLKYFYCKKDHIDLININDRTINYGSIIPFFRSSCFLIFEGS